MDIPISNFVASGGITGAVVVVAYMIYKLCKHKKFKSSCCGAIVEVKDDDGVNSPQQSSITPKLILRKEEEKKPELEV